MKSNLGIFLILAISFSFFSLIQTANYSFLCPDSFYHAKIASFLANGKLIKNFPWLPFTILAENYSDHHFLYHLSLVPFFKFLGNVWGIKIATLFFATFFICFFYWFLKKFKIRFPFFWTFLLLTSPSFLTRLNLAKTPSFALIILFLGLYFLFKRNFLLLGIISYLYVLSYNTWPILLISTIIYSFAWAIKKIFDQNLKFDLKILRLFFVKENIYLFLSSFFGVILGHVLNPYFPQNLYFNFVHIVKIGLKNYQNILPVGAEWYPFDPLSLVSSNLFIFTLWVVSIGWFLISLKKSKLPFSGQRTKAITFFILSSLFFLYTIKSRRNIEYFVPLAISFSSFSLNNLLKKFPWKLYLSQFKNLKEFPYNLMSAILGVFVFTIFIYAGNSFLKNVWQEKIKEFSGGWRVNKFKNVSEFLKENTKEGEIIFHSSWDEFPPLFYHNDKNYYIVGLDPTFMYEKNKPLYWIWQNITKGKQKENLSSVIKEIFKSKYVFVRADHEEMKKNLEKDKNFEKIYQDEDGVVYKIKD